MLGYPMGINVLLNLEQQRCFCSCTGPTYVLQPCATGACMLACHCYKGKLPFISKISKKLQSATAALPSSPASSRDKLFLHLHLFYSIVQVKLNVKDRLKDAPNGKYGEHDGSSSSHSSSGGKRRQ
jgi:hypothetical protein